MRANLGEDALLPGELGNTELPFFFGLVLVPIFDRLIGRKRTRGHVQAFTLTSFKTALLAYSGQDFIEARGFRILSGGPLRPLEELRSWWALLAMREPLTCEELQGQVLGGARAHRRVLGS